MNAQTPITAFHALEGEARLAARHVRSMTPEQRRAAWIESPDDGLRARDHAAHHRASLSPERRDTLNREWL